ncbi:hypothetical protein ACP70R_042058 [Stipagrostis hirtigluma subsp. patula]
MASLTLENLCGNLKAYKEGMDNLVSNLPLLQLLSR